MHPTDVLILRELVDGLARNHQLLRAFITEPGERERIDTLAKLAVHRAAHTIDLYEEDPLPERAAVGAMYAACDVALRLLHAYEQIQSCAENDPLRAWTIRDLRALISELFEWVIAPVGEPVLSVE